MDKDNQYFNQFQESISSVWGRKLYVEFMNQSAGVQKMLGKQLAVPMFVFSNSNTEHGSWNEATKTLTISYNLVENYEWEAVVHVLKHEMAHMIVSEIWGDVCDNGKVHGELFAKACNVLGIPSDRTFSPYEVFAKKEKIVSTVQKLFAMGESSFKEEASVAVRKAYELMARHNISSLDLPESDRRFVFRPVGETYLKVPTYVRWLASLVSKNYFVKAICNTCYLKGKHYRFLELYGEPHNVDVAEYVYHFLLAEGEREWNTFRTTVSSREYTKHAFLEGFYSGFHQSLEKERKAIMAEVDPKNTLPIGVNDPLLEEKFRKQYPDVTIRRGGGSNKLGRDAGAVRGRNVTIRQGVSQRNSGGLQLT